jgi:CBS domain-containing protein
MRKMSDLTRNQKPLVLPLHTTVREAAEHMRDRRVGAVLVVDDAARLMGIFTARDAVCRVLAQGKSPSETTLVEVMTADPDTIPSEHAAIEALRLMQDSHYRHLPIVNDGTVVGIVSRGDFRGSELDRLDEETGLWERI